MPSTDPRAVALYEPSGQGGIAHYTFELADALAQGGWKVTILTAEGYELADLSRRFDLYYAIRASRLKAWLSSSLARMKGLTAAAASESDPVHATKPATAPASAAPPAGQPSPLRSWINSARTLVAVMRVLLWLRARRIGVVHVQWLVDRRADLLFVRLLRLSGSTVILTVHDVLPHDEFTDANRRYFQKLYRTAHRLIVHSESNRRELLDLFELDPAHVSVIPHGAQTLFADHFAVSRTAARRTLALPETARILLFFGLIKRYKGLEYLLQAFEIIRARHGDAMLLVAGKIYDGDTQVYRHYSELLAPYRDRPDVRLASAYIPLDQVSLYFSAADVVVLPYVKASQSGVLLSAYAAGRPVVVTETGGLGEVVEDGVSGLIVPPHDAAAIAEASMSVLGDPETLRRMGLEAKRLAETIYSWESIATRTTALYRSAA